MKGGQAEFVRLGFGCVRLGSVSSGSSWRSDVALVREAIDMGVTFFDTADAYGNGVSEQILGRSIRARRSEVEVATKVGYRFSERSLFGQSVGRLVRPIIARRRPATTAPPGGRPSSYSDQDFSSAYIRTAVDASLRRLGTEYIDVLQLHGPPDFIPEVIDEVEQLIASGKVRRFGVGAESVASADQWLAFPRLATVQLPFGLLDPQAADGVLTRAESRGVQVWARGVLGGGLLSMVGASGSPLMNDPKWPLIDELNQLAQRADVSIFQLAISFVRSYPTVSTIVVGIHSRTHLVDNVRMMGSTPIDPAVTAEAISITSRWTHERERRG